MTGPLSLQRSVLPPPSALSPQVDHGGPGRSGAEEPPDGLVHDPSPFEVPCRREPDKLPGERRQRPRPR